MRFSLSIPCFIRDHSRRIGAGDQGDFPVFQTVETVKNNDFPLDFGKLHKRVNQLPGVFFPDHFLQKIGPGPGCVRCTGSLRFRAGLLPRKIGEAAVRRSLSAEVVITDISGYGQQVAFQVFAAADVHISDKTKKRLLRQIIRAGRKRFYFFKENSQFTGSSVSDTLYRKETGEMAVIKEDLL